MEVDGDPLQSPSETTEETSKPLIVILMGAPGSGKTTFCNDVTRAARRSWVRVCQDTIANGKAGTKSQCLKSAADALKNGKSVFIDRCNLEREQRADFVKLGGGQADVHVVVLDLPARLCISRSVKRTGHEGNLQGGRAAAVVNRMLQKKELPKLTEGFSRITFCQNESDVKDTVNTYTLMGPYDTLPSGSFGQKNADTKVQLGIMKFLKKAETSENVAHNSNNVISDGRNSRNSVQGNKEKDPLFMKPENENQDKKDTEGKDSSEKSYSGKSHSEDVHALAFPSISTSDFQFDHAKASDIIVDCVADFLSKVDNVRLILVDLSHKSHILSLVRVKAAKKNIDSMKFFTFVGDITRLHTDGNLRGCNAIANAANWRLKPGGGGVNAAIFNAAGEALEIATKEQADTLSPGEALAVPLPSTSPLYQREGVAHVIHVLGPNMNPQRPKCLKNDYVKGCRILHNAYSSLFEKFASISQSQIYSKESDRGPMSEFSRDNVVEGSSADYNGRKSKRENFCSSGRKRCKGLPSDTVSNDRPGMHKDNPGSGHNEVESSLMKSNVNARNVSTTSPMIDEKDDNKENAEGTKRSWGSWAQALHQIAMHPEKHQNTVIEISDDFVVLNDLYPKAKRHILLVSRLDGLDSLADVKKEHLPLMKKLHICGLRWSEKFLSEENSLIFRLGYHSVPSMRQLHLHVISQDFDSKHLKNKKHWNSFNSPFFQDSADVIEEIENSGVAKLNRDEKLLSMELRCHRCRSAHPTIPKLKSHIINCKAPFPSFLQNRLVLAPEKGPADRSASTFGTPPVLARSLPSENSTVGEDASTSESPAVPHKRSHHPTRVACRAQTHPFVGVQPQPTRGTRGPNQAHRLRPDASRGQVPFPLYWTLAHRYTGPHAERFGQYIGYESRHYKKYPLHLDWGEQHDRSFDLFWAQAQEDYAFLTVDPNEVGPEEDRVLDLCAIYRGLKTSMQAKVRYNRSKLKVDCYELWQETPAEERDALMHSHAFNGVDMETWPLLCEFFASEQKQKLSRQNKENRKSQKGGRATYTGGSKNMTRAAERARAQIVSTGGTPSLLQEYLCTHATSTDPKTGIYTFPDEATKEYCGRVVQMASTLGVNFTGETNPASLTPILDAVHGGHHGGYERGLGVGTTRFYLRRSFVAAFTSPTPMKRSLDAQVASLTATEMISSTGRMQPTAPQATPSAITQPASPSATTLSATPPVITPDPSLTASAISAPFVPASSSTPASILENLRCMGYNADQLRQFSQLLGQGPSGSS